MLHLCCLLGRSTVLSASHHDSVLNPWVQEVTAEFFHYKAPLVLLTNGLTYYHCLHKSKISSCKVVDSFICLVFFAHLLVGNLHLRKSLTDNRSYCDKDSRNTVSQRSFLFLLIGTLFLFVSLRTLLFFLSSKNFKYTLIPVSVLCFIPLIFGHRNHSWGRLCL